MQSLRNPDLEIDDNYNSETETRIVRVIGIDRIALFVRLQHTFESTRVWRSFPFDPENQLLSILLDSRSNITMC
jgi:hypothetical protein